MKRVVPIATVVVLIALPGTGRGGNTRSFFHGDDAALTGGAVVANTHDSGAVWYNPAGLGALERDKVDLSASAFMLRVRKIPSAIVTEIEDDTRAKGLKSTDIISVPAALVWVRHFNDRFSAGLGVFVTDYEVVNLHDVFEQDFNAEWNATGAYNQAINITATRQRYRFALALGWQLHKRFRLGLTRNFRLLNGNEEVVLLRFQAPQGGVP